MHSATIKMKFQVFTDRQHFHRLIKIICQDDSIGFLIKLNKTPCYYVIKTYCNTGSNCHMPITRVTVTCQSHV